MMVRPNKEMGDVFLNPFLSAISPSFPPSSKIKATTYSFFFCTPTFLILRRWLPSKDLLIQARGSEGSNKEGFLAAGWAYSLILCCCPEIFAAIEDFPARFCTPFMDEE